MFSAIRKRVTYANVAMTLAVVFAMSGGAYAAGKYVITSTKQISPKVLKSLKGANGKNGAAGPSGPVGAVGAAGPQGPAGAPGAKGETGLAGAPGTAGKEGKAGKEGSPWTAGGTLPSGSSETGVWGLNATAKEHSEVQIPISFTIPLAASLDAAHVHLIGFEEPTPEGCGGNESKPEAEPGNLCIWGAIGELVNGERRNGVPFLAASNVETFPASNGAGKNGVVLNGQISFEGSIGGGVSGRGEWVVSAP